MKIPNQDLKWMILALISDKNPWTTESIIAEYAPVDGKQIVAILVELWMAKFIGKVSHGPEQWFITPAGLKVLNDQSKREG